MLLPLLRENEMMMVPYGSYTNNEVSFGMNSLHLLSLLPLIRPLLPLLPLRWLRTRTQVVHHHHHSLIRLTTTLRILILIPTKTVKKHLQDNRLRPTAQSQLNIGTGVKYPETEE